MSRTTGWLVAGAILVGASGLAVFLVSQRPEPERRPPPSQTPFAVTAPVRAGEGAIPVFGAGTVRPRAEIDIAAEVSGKVVWVDPAFQSGGQLREGQVLFRLDDVDYRSAVEKARANVALQRVEVLKAREEAQVARKQYEQFKERQAESGAASEASPLALWQPQLEAAEAALARDAATLAETELNLARTAVKAPFAGVVRIESVDLGQFVAAGRGVARLYASDAVEVVVPLSDSDAALIPGLWDLRAGDGNREVAVHVLADYGGRRYGWNGYVDRVEGVLDEQTRTLDVIVRVPEPYRGGVPEAGGREDVDEAPRRKRTAAARRQVRRPGTRGGRAGRLVHGQAAGASTRQRSLDGARREGDDRAGHRSAAGRRRRVRHRRSPAGRCRHRGRASGRHRRHGGARRRCRNPIAPRQMSQRTGWAIGGLILIGALAAAASMVLLRPEPASRPPPALVPFALTAPVEAGEGAIPVHAAGTVQPLAEVDVAAEVSGKVVWVAPVFQSSGRVREGQPLFRIEDTDYLGRVQQARANVALQRVELLKVEEEAAVARSQYERFRERQGSEADSDAPSPLALWEPQLQAARRALERDGAILREAALNLARTEIRAPFDGIVRSESVDVGQYVAAGQSVGRLYASGSVEVVVPLSDDAAALLPGLWDLRAGEADTRIAARVIAEYGNGSYAWDGYLDRGAVTLDEQTRTIDVIVRVPRPFSSGAPVDAGLDAATAPPLLVGKFVDVELQGLAPEQYFRVPDSALKTGDEVWAVQDGKVTIVPVQVLQRSDDVVYVTGALEATQPVITGGVRLATEGMAVQTAGGGS